MTTPTLTLAAGTQVAPGTSFEVTPRVRRASFGDGYIQRSRDGINTMPKIYSVTIGPMTVANADTVEAFLTARGGVEAFFWQPPYAGSPLKWIATKWKRTNRFPTADGLDVTFEQVFDP